MNQWGWTGAILHRGRYSSKKFSIVFTVREESFVVGVGAVVGFGADAVVLMRFVVLPHFSCVIVIRFTILVLDVV